MFRNFGKIGQLLSQMTRIIQAPKSKDREMYNLLWQGDFSVDLETVCFCF